MSSLVQNNSTSDGTDSFIKASLMVPASDNPFAILVFSTVYFNPYILVFSHAVPA